MSRLLVIAGAALLSGCASGYQAEYRTDCNTTDADLQLRIHQIAVDLSAKVGAPLRHGEGLAPAIEYDIDLPSGGGQVILREYNRDITVRIDASGSAEDASAKHLRELIEQALKQNSCEEWQLS